MKPYQYASLKQIAADADDLDATLKLFQETGVASAAEADAIKTEIENPQPDPTSFDEILAALEDEGCHDVAKRLHTVLTSTEEELDAMNDEELL